MRSDVIKSGLLGKRVHHWNIPPLAFWLAGLKDDFLFRGSVQCLAGIIANDPAEAVSFNTTIDGTLQRFDASNRYVVRYARHRKYHGCPALGNRSRAVVVPAVIGRRCD